MKRAFAVFMPLVPLVLGSLAQAQSAKPQALAAKPSTPAATAAALPYTPSLDLASMAKSIDPCVDFYQYPCGGWQKNNPIPPDQTSWGVYGKLYQDNLNFLRGILEEAAAKAGNPVEQKIGDFYAACMDESAVEKRGVAAIKP